MSNNSTNNNRGEYIAALLGGSVAIGVGVGVGLITAPVTLPVLGSTVLLFLFGGCCAVLIGKAIGWLKKCPSGRPGH